MIEDFVLHFEKQDGIDPRRKNSSLIKALFKRWETRHEYGLKLHECTRNSGVTRTLMEWALWIDEPVLVITEYRDPWKQLGIEARSWKASIKGVCPRPQIVLIDNPVNRDVLNSVTLSARFNSWLKQLPFAAFYADQRLAQGWRITDEKAKP